MIMETRIGNRSRLMLGLVGVYTPFLPAFSLVVSFRFACLNLSCTFSPSLHLGNVLLLDLIVFSRLELSFSLDIVMSGHVFIRLDDVLPHVFISLCPSFTFSVFFI